MYMHTNVMHTWKSCDFAGARIEFHICVYYMNTYKVCVYMYVHVCMYVFLYMHTNMMLA